MLCAPSSIEQSRTPIRIENTSILRVILVVISIIGAVNTVTFSIFVMNIVIVIILLPITVVSIISIINLSIVVIINPYKHSPTVFADLDALPFGLSRVSSRKLPGVHPTSMLQLHLALTGARVISNIYGKSFM